MAKKAAKETSTPLVVALVFFVLTTIAFGVMWYMQYSDQQAKDDTVKKAQQEATAAKGEAADAQLKAKVYQAFMGTADGETITSLNSETKGKEKIAAELKKINEGLAKAAGEKDGSLPSALSVWPLDDRGQPGDTPTRGLVAVAGDSHAKRREAEAREKKTMVDYTSTVTNMKAAIDDFKKSTDNFNQMAKDEPKKFEARLNAEIKKYEDRKAEFAKNEKTSRDLNEKLDQEKAAALRENKKLQTSLDETKQQVTEISSKLTEKKDPFQFDEPQGKVIRRLADDIVEISLGSTDMVKPGLTFTVLPYDFPEKGRQSRMKVVRLPNERGEYKNVERFMEKATIEVIEVLGPRLSRARITSEPDPIRDGAAAGDLLYNSAWRKGTADHVALVGIFDINGDGTDDIELLVRDLLRMGIPVDAYLDLKERKWVGQMTEQTRYLIVGRYPVQSITDPNQAEKTAIHGTISKGVADARQKGIQDINYRDFFPRMGYRVKVDVSDDKINQATSPYLKGVNTAEPPGGN